MTLLDAQGNAAKPTPVLAVCVPAGDRCATMFTYDLVRMLLFTQICRPELRMLLFINKGTIIPEQRHLLVREALKEEAVTHILWIDSDMRFPKDAALRLLGHGKPVVACNYATRRQPCQPVAGLPGDGKSLLFSASTDTELEAVKWCGMGFMLVEADFYRNNPAPWFAVGFSRNEDGYAGEDVFFCDFVQRAGLEVLIDPVLSRQIAHCGEFEFTLDHAIATLRFEIAQERAKET